ncbi:MAG: SPASM domain-containing protein, partial [Clostridiales bacterium]|nr:SPASM domain-containing protein [Clostridiales bacterium]
AATVQANRRLAALCRERRLEGRPFNFFHFNIDLQRGPCLPKRLWGCGAGYEYLAVDPAGLLYPCHQFVGREGFCLGNVDEGVTNAELPRRFRAAHIYNKPACRACWARYFCSGGCHANAHAVSGDFLQPHPLGCLLQKERLECAIWLAVREVLDEPPVR